jgi:hypothetical protein
MLDTKDPKVAAVWVPALKAGKICCVCATIIGFAAALLSLAMMPKPKQGFDTTFLVPLALSGIALLLRAIISDWLARFEKDAIKKA